MNKYFTHYHAYGAPISQPWFGIGPVWDENAVLAGISIQFGSHGFAIHRGVK